MTQAIDPIKRKASAEYLEWVLKQYPDSEDVQSLLRALAQLIEDAKTGRVQEPVERIPGSYVIADGLYRSYVDPDVENAYYEFVAEMRGGRDEQEKQLIADTQAMIDRMKTHE